MNTKGVCQEYIKGKCIRGDSCPFSHPDMSKVFGKEGYSLNFSIATDDVVVKESDRFNEATKPSAEKSIPEDSKERKSLFEQLKDNLEEEENKLAERRKLMYGVRPMDEDEFKDYEQVVLARKDRERLDKERKDREEKLFQLMQKENTDIDNEEESLLLNLSFGDKTKKKQPVEKKPKNGIIIKAKKAKKAASTGLVKYTEN